jgi:integrase
VVIQTSDQKRTGKRGNGEGSLYFQKARGRWVGSLSLEGGKRKALYGRTRQEVAKKLAAALQAREQGMLVSGPRQTLGHFLTRWLEDSVKPTLRPRSYVAYDAKVRNHILPELGRIPLSSLTPQHLQRLYARKLANGYSPTTVSLVHTILHRALKQALRWGLVARNVAEAVDSPRPDRRKPNPFTRAELDVLRQAMQGHRYEPFWTLLMTTGLRFGEAAALRWNDVDLEARTVSITRALVRLPGGYGFSEPKTAKGRRILPLPTAAILALEQQRARVRDLRLLAGEKWEEQFLVFPNSLGRPLREDHVLTEFHKLQLQNGIPRRRLHDLRHTYATRLFALNQHPRAVQDLLGHSRIDSSLQEKQYREP